jgi:hypothetical protein
MPRRGNNGPQNAAARREIRINVISRHQNLRNKIRNVSNYIRRNDVNRVSKEMAKADVAQMAIHIFTRNYAAHTLPMRTSKIFEKLLEAWPHAVQRAARRAPARTPARSSPRRASPVKYTTSLPPVRNVKFAIGPNGKPVIVYFPNN